MKHALSVLAVMMCSGSVLAEVDFRQMIPAKLPRHVFKMREWNVWTQSVVKGDDGKYHMFFGRWPKSSGFSGWVHHGEVAHAVSDCLLGPYTFKDVVLPRRGAALWDGGSTFCPHIIRIDGKYYLYYTGTTGRGHWKEPPSGYLPGPNTGTWWAHRNNQRIGVAVADNPNGPWKRFDKPLIDAKAGRHAAGVPVVFQRHDGRIQMIYKSVTEKPGDKGGPLVHVMTTADNPLGPFRDHPHPFIRYPKTLAPIDDHLEWCQGRRYYCIGKDNGENFTKYGTALILFESDDGFDWKLSENHPLVHEFKIHWEDGEIQHFQRLEMPKLYFEDGQPKGLFLAARPVGSRDGFGIAIALRPQESFSSATASV